MKNKGKLKFLTTIAGIGAICASTFAIAYEIVKNSISSRERLNQTMPF